MLLIVREEVRLAVAIQILHDHPWPTANGLRQFIQERLERHLRIFLAGQNQERIDVPLAVSWSALPGFFGHEDYGTVVFRLSILIGFHGRRQKLPVRIAFFIAATGRWAADVRWNSLGRHLTVNAY